MARFRHERGVVYGRGGGTLAGWGAEGNGETNTAGISGVTAISTGGNQRPLMVLAGGLHIAGQVTGAKLPRECLCIVNLLQRLDDSRRMDGDRAALFGRRKP